MPKGRLTRAELAAIAVVAEVHSAVVESGDGPPDAWLAKGGKRIALDAVALPQSTPADFRPRLRFDKVVVSLASRLREQLQEVVPDDKAVIVTVTAPIRLWAKTAVSLHERIALSLRGDGASEVAETVHGNATRFRIVKRGPAGAAHLLVFVHNPETDARLVVGAAQALLECLAASARKRSPKAHGGERWLAISNEAGMQHIETWQHIQSALGIPSSFSKVLMVLAGGRVAVLAPRTNK